MLHVELTDPMWSGCQHKLAKITTSLFKVLTSGWVSTRTLPLFLMPCYRPCKSTPRNWEQNNRTTGKRKGSWAQSMLLGFRVRRVAARVFAHDSTDSTLQTPRNTLLVMALEAVLLLPVLSFRYHPTRYNPWNCSPRAGSSGWPHMQRDVTSCPISRTCLLLHCPPTIRTWYRGRGQVIEVSVLRRQTSFLNSGQDTWSTQPRARHPWCCLLIITCCPDCLTFFLPGLPDSPLPSPGPFKIPQLR